MPLYDERLDVPRTWWLLALLAGVAPALAVAPLGPRAALGGLAAGVCTAATAAACYGSARIRVAAGTLTAGGIRMPVEALGIPEILDAEEAFAWRTHRADPRAPMLLRSYVPTALRIEVRDPSYGVPYLYLSTRRPANLAAVLAFARR